MTPRETLPEEYLNGVGQGGGETPSCLSSSVNFFIRYWISTRLVNLFCTLGYSNSSSRTRGSWPAAVTTPVGIGNNPFFLIQPGDSATISTLRIAPSRR